MPWSTREEACACCSCCCGGGGGGGVWRRREWGSERLRRRREYDGGVGGDGGDRGIIREERDLTEELGYFFVVAGGRGVVTVVGLESDWRGLEIECGMSPVPTFDSSKPSSFSRGSLLNNPIK